MKLTYFFVFAATLIGFSSSLIAQGWTQLTDFPSSARDDGTSFTIGSITYCGTGLDATWNPTSDFFALDMTTDNWSAITGIPADEARQYPNGFSSQTHGYIFGGLNSTGYLNDLWQFDPVTEIWTELSPMPSVGRSGASCFVIGDTAYILGGQTQTLQANSEVWAYSMSSDSWTSKNAMPESLWRASSIAYQNKGYLLLGRDNNGIYRNEMYAYTPATDSWSTLSNFPGVGRTYVGISILEDKIVTIAGRDSIGNSYNDMWEYSSLSDTWSLAVNLPSDQRRGGICFYSPTSIYYTTGIDLTDTRLTETWKYDLLLAANDLKENAFVLYPNPTSDALKISGISDAEEFSYQITTVQGRTMKVGDIKTNASIDVRNFSKGSYLITIYSQTGNTTKRFVVN